MLVLNKWSASISEIYWFLYLLNSVILELIIYLHYCLPVVCLLLASHTPYLLIVCSNFDLHVFDENELALVT